MKVIIRCQGQPAASTRSIFLTEYEHISYDPKDGELCLSRVKSGETQMEARSDTDVQIVRRT
jgi:hypothetical protein